MALLAKFVGIDRHSDPKIRDLNGAARDAKALWALFSDSVPDDLGASLLVDSAATLDGVRAALDVTLGRATPDDVVLLSFAGHGTPDHRLVMADSRLDDVPATTIPMGELAERFRQTKARAVILLLDCCFSGGAPARVIEDLPAPRDPGTPLEAVAGNGRLLFAASGVAEPALEDPISRHGLFTHAIIEGLLGKEQPVSAVALVDEVVRSVRANAARFGHVQTPVMFGHVEGELSLPALRRGPRFAEVFPEQAIVQVDQRFESLAPYGIDAAVLQAWTARYPGGLNALQVSAINDHGVLNGESLFVVAPTSAGKTFIGEIAAMRAIGAGQKAVFLLPYKALVNEKFLDFSEIYGAILGLRVIRCSGDWQDDVGAFLRGKYDIAFLTYEKFLGLSLVAPYVLNQIGLVVLDEAQFITQPGRGMSVELLLTSLVSAKTRGVKPQIVALSAVIGNANAFDEWLGARLLVADQRPVPLIEGVLDRAGTRTFRQDGRDQEDQFLPRGDIRQRREKPSSQDVIVPLVRQLIREGEKVIVFRNARGPAAGAAEYLGAELGLPAAQVVLDALPVQDLSSDSERLRNALGGGVAFHSSDLSREERAAVERGFRQPDGGIQVLVATTTVAAGVNTPASTVIVVETFFFGDDGRTPFTVAEYKNMAGRAGRLGFEVEGKSLLLVDNSMERRRLYQQYVSGFPEPIRSSFDSNHPATWIVKLLAQVREIERDQVVNLVANTYGGFLIARANQNWRNEIGPRVLRLLARMQADRLIEERDGKLALTMLGRACAEAPFDFESSMQLVEMIRRLNGGAISAEALMAIVQALPETDADYTPMSKGRGEAAWPGQAIATFGQAVVREMQTRAQSDTAFYARCKRALILAEWIRGTPLQDIEQRFSLNPYFGRVGAGDIRGFSDGTRFLLEAALRIEAIVRGLGADEEADALFLKRLEVGLPAEALPLTELGVVLTRGECLALFRANVRDRNAVMELNAARLVELLGAMTADRLRRALAPGEA